MYQFALPFSIVITQSQLEWLDQRRQEGALSRSAAMRVILDQFIRQQSALQQSAAGTPSSRA